MKIRLIPRLDIKGPNLIKGIHLEGLRVIGDPQVFARKYYEEGADELLYVDVVASLYGRNSLHEIVKRTAHDVFVPLTVAGGLRSVDDVKDMLRSGADKVGINTAAIKRPELIKELAHKFGSQCVVLSIEAKTTSAGHWEAYADNGRERTGFDVVEWAQRGVELGAGEILLTSVDREGTRKGFDLELIAAVTRAVPVPVIVSGGMGRLEDVADAVQKGHADAVSMADILHYGRASLAQIKSNGAARGSGHEDCMSASVTIIDYGIGNLFSVQRAFEHSGAQVGMARHADDLEAASRLVLPGVGAFADGMQGLRERGLIEPLRHYAASGRPLLGICLGMQMLATSSAEFGDHEGLDLIPGKVLPIPKVTSDGRPQKIPHIGWADLSPAGRDDWNGTVLADIPAPVSMYLVHSFNFHPDADADLLATCSYGGHQITAAVQRNNVIGCQFHPEKSAHAGLSLLSRFMKL